LTAVAVDVSFVKGDFGHVNERGEVWTSGVGRAVRQVTEDILRDAEERDVS
jgi:hypothetical protein